VLIYNLSLVTREKKEGGVCWPRFPACAERGEGGHLGKKKGTSR